MRQLRNIIFIASIIGVPILGQCFADTAGVDAYRQAILIKIALNITLAVGLSLIIGFTGQFSLGHAAFMSVGAIVSAFFSGYVIIRWTGGVDPAWLEGATVSAILLRSALLALAMLVGTVAAALASIVVGIPSLRLRGDYLAIATLGFGEIVYNLILIYIQRTAADTAFYIPNQLNFMANGVNIASSWILALLAIVVVRNIVSATAGRALPAIREDEIGSMAVGIRTTRYKLLAFLVGSMFAGAAGALEGHQILTVNPGVYRFDRSIEIIVPVVLGGSGSLSGCILASAGFTYLLERLRDLPAQQYRTIVYAAVLVLVMVLRPQGLMGRWEIRDVWNRLRRRRPQPQAAKSTAPDAGIVTLNPKSDAPLALECQDLVIKFGGLTAVNGFNLTLRNHEILGLIGPNGAGKTTCFNMITGMYRPTSGNILLNGHSLVGLGPARINHRGIARTFQNIRLFTDLSVLDNVRIALHAHLKTGVPSAVLRTNEFYREEARTRQTAEQLLDIFGLLHKADLNAGSLPYGDQRRLEIARALATRPRVLCLDEPAAGMNPAEKSELMDLIRRLRDRFQLAVLLIEHDMRVVMGVCERIIVLDHGEMIAQGKPEEIRDNPKVIEAYLGEPVKVA
ncbi:MAG: branched-chain amino acid ABC transporter ATP-binding protein/permease [Planctomycetes bacterium]|nr:branched-chain amino acid ABC transporter ATP-binding protein/permease [Planctomycetota bacterium]MBI3835172.1 branched-chain amino acid ABC transporter ATP-binding protein/permease [Planctomycetota bacterium]